MQLKEAKKLFLVTDPQEREYSAISRGNHNTSQEWKK